MTDTELAALTAIATVEAEMVRTNRYRVNLPSDQREAIDALENELRYRGILPRSQWRDLQGLFR